MLKSLLLSCACVATLTAAAQKSASFTYIVSTHQDNWDENVMMSEDTNPSTTDHSRLCTWFDSDFAFQIINHAEGTFTPSSIYKDSASDLIATKVKTEKNRQSLHGIYVTPEYDTEMLYVTVPDKYYDKSDKLTDVTAPGSIVYHITLGTSGNRINDTDNIWGAYLYEMSGARIAVIAPSYAVIKASFGTPGVKYQNVTCAQQAIVDFPAPEDNKYTELTSGIPYNSNAISDVVTWAKWPNGYCCKFIDVVISNLKVGDRVGFGGIQTLYPGCEDVKLTGVEETVADENNAPAVYYNLQGIRVDNPTNGVFIRMQGNKATKVAL